MICPACLTYLLPMYPDESYGLSCLCHFCRVWTDFAEMWDPVQNETLCVCAEGTLNLVGDGWSRILGPEEAEGVVEDMIARIVARQVLET